MLRKSHVKWIPKREVAPNRYARVYGELYLKGLYVFMESCTIKVYTCIRADVPKRFARVHGKEYLIKGLHEYMGNCT